MTRTDSTAGQGGATLPGNVTAAAVFLFILGTLAGLVALFGFISTPTKVVEVSGGVTRVTDLGLTSALTILVLGGAVTAAHIAAGRGILRGRAWGRILGLVVSGMAIVVLLLSLLYTVAPATLLTNSLALGTVMVTTLLIAAYALVIWAVARHGNAFA